MSKQADVVIAGGGIAGCCVAAALASIGKRVLVVEAGLHVERRLAGELLHPPGIAALRELNLLRSPLVFGTPIEGMNVFCDASAVGHGTQLRYRAGTSGCSFRHEDLRDYLVARLREIPGVTYLRPARITGLRQRNDGPVLVTVEETSGNFEVDCEMLVGADGSASHVRRLSGIAACRQRLGTLSGYTVDEACLPVPELGHVFACSRAPVVAYRLGNGRARVVLDHPQDDENDADAVRDDVISSLPGHLGAQVAEQISAGNGRRCASYKVRVRHPAAGRVVLVGDAAGTCHPLTASGMTRAMKDAILLRRSLANCRPAEVERAILMYARARNSPERARQLLAAAMYRVMCARTPGALLLRNGMRAYWESGERRRTASMGLLSTDNERLGSILLQNAGVLFAALRGSSHPSFDCVCDAVSTIKGCLADAL